MGSVVSKECVTMRKSCIAVGLLLAFLFVPHARGQKNTGGNSVEEIKLVVFATFGREAVSYTHLTLPTKA